ncbi:uncharacterized protein LOC128673731 [Plodia interpunctella]|uniref:uncharacterized protein LOC128673731 n=1 Tax=Plodia interpunctella TaxID=58824 RepID=UPI00236892AA|nr:uncharacterized protein LOC128673731 [Plodia interpunctella]XP_053607760.1 uncharacterized protein LOC128673731 [Plodia interpunctella]
MGCGSLRRWSARRWCGALLLAAVALQLARLAAPAPAALVSTVTFPRAQAAAVAHLLADFSTHPSPFSIPVSWSIEKEASNYTSWRYSVSYECGPRCAGGAEVAAHDDGGPRHGLAARAHRVRVINTFCVSLLLLPWLQFCGEIETMSVVRADEMSGGALLEERAEARCGAAAALALGGRCGRAHLQALRAQHLQYVRAALARDH